MLVPTSIVASSKYGSTVVIHVPCSGEESSTEDGMRGGILVYS